MYIDSVCIGEVFPAKFFVAVATRHAIQTYHHHHLYDATGRHYTYTHTHNTCLHLFTCVLQQTLWANKLNTTNTAEFYRVIGIRVGERVERKIPQGLKFRSKNLLPDGRPPSRAYGYIYIIYIIYSICFFKLQHLIVYAVDPAKRSHSIRLMGVVYIF